jgi:hypothetical protein
MNPSNRPITSGNGWQGAPPAGPPLQKGRAGQVPTEVHFDPTLFICLGTSAGEVGWRLRRLLSQVYGEVRVLRYLWLDTDRTVDPAAAPYFSANERVELEGFDGNEVLAHVDAYPAIKAWWPRDSRLKPGFIRRGAQQIRPHGRLSLFRMFNDRTKGLSFIDKLRGSVDALQHIQNVEATEAMSTESMRYVVERGGARVVLIFSTCGGTGSALAFDVAYLCRHLLQGVNASIIAVALLPSVLDRAIQNETPLQREKIRANTYAWFKEHEYLLENPSWHVEYPEGAPVRLQAPPFDLTFVVGLGNQAGDRLNSEDDIFTMVAQAIFLDTGSAVAGAMRGFNTNVSVLMEEFGGRQRAYSSLAAVSLVLPADRIQEYCAARWGQALLQAGLLPEPEVAETGEAVSALLGRTRLRDAHLLDDLLAERQVANLNAPAMRKAKSVEEIRSLLTIQESRDVQERQRQTARIAVAAADLLAAARESLEREAVGWAVVRGLPFAGAALEFLTAQVEDVGSVPDSTLSCLGLKVRLTQLGVGEGQLAQAEQEYRAARERLRALEGGLWQSTRKRLRPATWKRDLDRVRNDCLGWLAEINRNMLQLAAQREAASLYDQLAEDARDLGATLAQVRQAVECTLDDLGARAEHNLKPATAAEGIYELALEVVDADYIRAYYRAHAAGLDPAAAYRAFAAGHGLQGREDLQAWTESRLVQGLLAHARGYFAQALQSTSLLEALAEYHGDDAAAVIGAWFDRVVRFCHPFWQYNPDSGIHSQEGKSIIGVEDEHSALIPARYRGGLQYEIKSNGFKHRIDVARMQHGLPAFLLRGMQDWRACYEARRKGLDPLHILPEAAQAEDVVPEEQQEAREIFAVAAAFGYIVQIGSWYYSDPGKDYQTSQVHPGRENQLAQGREKAEEAFVQRDGLVGLTEEWVEQEIVTMGNRAAVALLDARIADLKAVLAKMPVENDLRRQYQKEIRALEAKQRQLGRIEPEPESLVTTWHAGGDGGEQRDGRAGQSFGTRRPWLG